MNESTSLLANQVEFSTERHTYAVRVLTGGRVADVRFATRDDAAAFCGAVNAEYRAGTGAARAYVLD